MRRLMAHMSRSLGVMFHLRDSSLQAASNLSSLERLSTGVVLLSGDGTLQFANAAAERIFRAGRHVAAPGGHSGTALRLTLVARLADHEKQFQRAIARALTPLDDHQENFSNAVVLPDEQGKPSCVLHAAPLGSGLALAAAGARPQAIVFLYDMGAAARVAPGLLCELFDLTGAEASAALQVLQGGAAEAMARRLDISVNTFKTQMKAVYAKTRTSRHSDLLKLMLALAVA
jgi:DNA-binding CsgD family transcriptional regulator